MKNMFFIHEVAKNSCALGVVPYNTAIIVLSHFATLNPYSDAGALYA